MRTAMSSAIVAVAAVACGGCATGVSALRAHGERGAPLVTQHVSAPLEPATGLLLANPLDACNIGACGGEGCGVVWAACMTAVTAVDLLAMPAQAVRRSGERGEIERIRRACPLLEDPPARLADAVGARLIREFGFSPPPPDGAAPPANAVVLEVRTTRFTRSSVIAWEATIVLREAADGEVLWRGSCRASAPRRAVNLFESQCALARTEVAALADGCAERFVSALRKAWDADAERSRRTPELDPQDAFE